MFLKKILQIFKKYFASKPGTGKSDTIWGDYD